MSLKAIVWDVDGTVAETERDGHRVAFNLAFAELGLAWRWDIVRYGELLHVAGGRERLLHDMAARPDAPPEGQREWLAAEVHARKTRHYAALLGQGRIVARPGVLRLMDECRHAGVRMAIATTTTRANVEALFPRLLGAGWAALFGAVVCADDAPRKKPDPQAHALALQRLGVAAREAFAIEDSPAGLQAARAAGVPCGITRSAYFAAADFSGALWVRDDLDAPPPMTLARLGDALSAKIGTSRITPV